MIGIIGDLHFKESLGYAEYIKDHRVGEKKKILDFIVEEFSDCDAVVFMGDQLNSRNNTSEVIRDFVSFVERFDGKEVFIIKGNHESTPHGRSAIDFMKEIILRPYQQQIISAIVNELKKRQRCCVSLATGGG
jgi:DNA repair exonuclease SbcCD nuclease subunit